MRIGVHVPNFGPGTTPEMLLRWARMVEGLGFDLLMISDHVVVTPDVAARCPPPIYEPFTTLAWLAGNTRSIGLGTTVLSTPYRHPLLTARMAANLGVLSGGRLVLGVGVGWARQEFAALGVPFEQRGRLTDRYLNQILDAWKDERDYPGGGVPLWIGGNSDAGLRRAVRLGAPWHPLRFTLPWFRDALARMAALADAADRPVPALTPRIVLRITDAELDDARRLTGEGSLAQILTDLAAMRELGADTVVLDTSATNPAETLRPERAWRDLATVADVLRGVYLREDH